MDSKKLYIPGFDWAKLIGSILVAANHVFLSSFIEGYVDARLIALLSSLVPVFFLMAGFLMYQSVSTKPNPVRYMWSYILKYGSLYYALCLICNLIGYTKIWMDTGVFGYKSLLFEMLTAPCYWPPMMQLWFLPPLIVGVAINVPIYLRGWDRRFLWLLVPLVVIVNVFSAYEQSLMRLAPMRAVADWKYFNMASYFITYSTQGILYVYLGMWIAKHRDGLARFRLWWAAVPALVVTAMEAFLICQFGGSQLGDLRTNVIVCIWAVLILLFILRMKGSSLQKYHGFVSLFSGLLYFLHVGLAKFLKIWIPNKFLCFLAVLTIIFGISALVVLLTERKQKGEADGL